MISRGKLRGGGVEPGALVSISETRGDAYGFVSDSDIEQPGPEAAIRPTR